MSLLLDDPLKGLDDLTVLRCCWDFAYTVNCLNGWWTTVKNKDHGVFFEAGNAYELNIKILCCRWGCSRRWATAACGRS